MLARYRSLAVPLAVLAAVVLFYLVNPWFYPAAGSTERAIASVAFWVLMIAALVLLFTDRNAPEAQTVEVEGPSFTRYLFNNTRAGLVWLPIRLFLGFEWATAGWEKLTGKGWVDGGSALLGYWKSAVAVPTTGHAAITFEWYRSFLQLLIDNGAQSWFAWLITLGELAVGIGLIVGLLTGIAAFFGVTMNMSYLLAGSASVNPIMFAFSVGLMLAWRVAGYYGLDRWVLPMLGVPWQRDAKPVVAAPPAVPPAPAPVS
ncbi:MAG: DoxX family membrane protein [Candidatus Limnocylindrales bacterium]